MKAHLKYLWYILKHKWYVFRAGQMLGVPFWILIKHDASKFSRAEWTPYVHFFYRKDLRGSKKVSDRWKIAWYHHLKCNPHQWQYWLEKEWKLDTSDFNLNLNSTPLRMPHVYMLEMIADWIGAGKAQNNGHVRDWYMKNYEKIELHPDTRFLVNAIIESLWKGTSVI